MSGPIQWQDGPNLTPPCGPATKSLKSPLPSGIRARSSAVEHYVDIVGVTSSILVAPTILPIHAAFGGMDGKDVTPKPERRRRADEAHNRCRRHTAKADLSPAPRTHKLPAADYCH